MAKTSKLQKNLESHGAEFGSIDSVIAIQATSGILDIAIGTEGKIPFDLGLNNVDLKEGVLPRTGKFMLEWKVGMPSLRLLPLSSQNNNYP